MFRSALLLVALCAIAPSAHAQAQTEQEAARNRARPYIEGKVALEHLVASQAWDVESARTVELKINEIKGMLSDFNQFPSFRAYAKAACDQYTDLAFTYADNALKRREFDTADRAYRDIISLLVGSSYSGIRERAKIGLDDIREARNAHSDDIGASFDLRVELEKLQQMKKDDLISDAEYAELRQAAIAKSRVD